jgi:predicted nucleic acid-binding protein
VILLDTNVLSEFMRPAPSHDVVRWLDQQVRAQVWICAISRAEIELGLALMPEGQRQAGLKRAAQKMFTEDFAGRCLAFDDEAVIHYGHIVADRTRQGRPISLEDAQIAAVAVARGLTLATRNTQDFESIDRLTVCNPWERY